MGTMQGTITLRVARSAQSWDGTSPELAGWKASIFDAEQTEHEATNHLWALAHMEVAKRALDLVNFSRASRGAEGSVKL